jgi:hypothetical protein
MQREPSKLLSVSSYLRPHARRFHPNNLEAAYLRTGGGRPVELFGGDREALLVAGALWREGTVLNGRRQSEGSAGVRRA